MCKKCKEVMKCYTDFLTCPKCPHGVCMRCFLKSASEVTAQTPERPKPIEPLLASPCRRKAESESSVEESEEDEDSEEEEPSVPKSASKSPFQPAQQSPFQPAQQ
eukprot:Sspe_Gene.33442::Locus_16326_Transcript_1_1_Confidence_1.000_Length_2413::g.33442::m.33442